MGYDAVEPGRSVPTFRDIVFLPLSEYMSKAVCGKDRRMWGQRCGQASRREVEVQRNKMGPFKTSISELIGEL